MDSTKLYFATNRKHKGKNRWNPDKYGKEFSSDGYFNLRFGELIVDFDKKEIKKYISKKYDENRFGDGEGLSIYFSKRAKSAKITAYEDLTSVTKKEIPSHKNSSNQFFTNIKEVMLQSTDVVIYIHGYNVSWKESVGAAISLQFMLNKDKSESDKKIMVVLFSWPSKGSMMPFAAYNSDRNSARDSAEAVGRAILKLRDYLGTLREKSINKDSIRCNQEIHLLTHSMGNYVMQNALNKIIEESKGQYLPQIFQNIFLCAPDVDDNVLEIGKPMERLHEIAKNITIYYNNNDKAMDISDITKGNIERLGHNGNAHLNLVHNKVQQVDCTNIVSGVIQHSYYLWATVNNDITQTINNIEFDSSLRNRKLLGNNREWKLI